MKDVHHGTEAVYQCPTPIVGFLKGALSFFKQFKDGFRRV
jgi:hypothetical protein